MNNLRGKADKRTCDQCHKWKQGDNLHPDFKNNRYLCDSCYEPRDEEKEKEREPEDIDGGCEGGDIDDEPIEDEEEKQPDQECRAKRGEARIERIARSERTRNITERDKLKSLIW